MTQPIQFGIRIDVDRRQARAELEGLGDDVTNTSNRIAQAGQAMASGLAAVPGAVAASAQSVNAFGETEAQTTERIRNMVAASVAQTTALAESAAAADNAATATRRVNTENTDLAATLARQTAQMARSTALPPVQAQSSEESEKYVAALRRQADMVGLNAAEQAKLETKLRGGSAALQAQAYAAVDNAQALREQIAAEQKSSQAADAFIAKLKEQVDTLGMSRTQLLAHRAAQLGVADAAAPLISRLNEAGASANAAGAHAEGLSFKTAGARKELLVLAHELSQGQFQRFGGSMMVLGEQTGAAGLLFSAAGLTALGLAAAVGVVGYAMVKGASDQKEMQNALILSGNYAGLTSDSLNDLAHQAVETGGSIGEAKKAVIELAGTGKFTSEQIGQIGQAAVAMELATGQSIQKTIKQFESLAVESSGNSARSTEAISKAALKLNDQYHFLTEAVYEQIRALEKEGDAKGASALATETLAKVTKDRADQIISNTGYIAKGWHGVKEAIGLAIDAMGDWGKKVTPAMEVARLQKEIAQIDNGTYSATHGGSRDAYDQATLTAIRASNVKALAKAQDDLNKVNQTAAEQGRQAAIQAEGAHAASRITYDDTRLQKKGLGELEVALREYADDVAKVRAANPNSSLVTDDAVAAHIAAIKKAHAESQKGNNDRAKLLQDALLQEQTALDREKSIYDDRDKMLTLYHTKFGTSDAEFYAGRKSARDEYIAAEAAAFAREADLIKSAGTKASTPAEIAANKEKYDALLRQHLQFLDKMKAQSTEDAVNEAADAKKRYDDTIKAIQANGVEEVKQLDGAIAKQKEHNAEIGKTKEQIELARKAVVDLQTAQLESDAEFIRNALAKEQFNTEARTAYEMRLQFLEQEIAKRKELAGVMASGAILEANATAAKRAATDWNDTAKTVSTTLADAIANGGGNAWKKLKASIVSQVLNVPINMVSSGAASFLNPTAPQAQGAVSTVGNALQTGNSFVNMAGNAGSAILAAGNFAGSSTIAAFGSGLQLGGGATEAIAAYNAAGLTSVGSAMSAGSAISTAIAAIPGWGWAAMGAAALIGMSGIFGHGKEDDTHLKFASNNTAGNISINERGNEGKTNQSYIDDFGTSSFGTFGVASSFWMSSAQPAVQQFIQTVSKTDDVLAGFLSSTEQASVKSYLTGKDYTAHTGAEGDNPNSKGQLDDVFKERLNNIFEGIQPGLSGLIQGFSGTTQELATEAAAILKYRQALTDQGEALFGAKVSLEQIAALRLPTEATSVALTRVANEFSATNQVALSMGKTVQDVWGTIGLESEKARQQLISAAGGLDHLSQGAAYFAENFLTDDEKNAPLIKSVKEQMSALGLESVTTKDQFKDLVKGLDLTTEAGAKEYAQLMDLAPAFLTAADATAAAIDKATQAAKDAEEAASKSISDAQSALAGAYDQESNRLANLIKLRQDEAAAIQKQIDSLKLGDLSTLTPEQKYQEAKRQFENAKPEDQAAAAQAFLEASRSYYGSTSNYAKDYAMVQSSLAKSANAAQSAANIAQQQLDQLKDQVGNLIKIEDNTKGVREAILELGQALLKSSKPADVAQGNSAIDKVLTQTYQDLLGRDPDADGFAWWKDKISHGLSYDDLIAGFENSDEYKFLHGSHANGLDYVPFDGYRAELHQGERVQTAAQVANERAASAQIVRLLNSLLEEARADKPQRAEVARATLDKLDQVADGLQATKRQIARKA